MHRRPQLRQYEGEERVLRVLRDNPEQSLDDIAFAANYARCTVHYIIKRLEHQALLTKIRGRGRYPNRYEIGVRGFQYQLI